MVQKLTGRLEKVEEKGDLTDEVGKLGEAITGAVEKLGDKTEKLGEAMTGAVESLTRAVETLGDKLTDGLDNQASTTNDPTQPSSCVDVKEYDKTNSVHTLEVGNKHVTVFCDQQTAGGGWTVILRRHDGSVDFYRNWEEYRRGFGNLTGEFWLGLDNMHLLTTARNQTLRVDLEDFDNNRAYAEYRFFAIDGPDSFYRLHVDGDSLAVHNNLPFSTHDNDHDSWSGNCAVSMRGAWWYIACHVSHLTGPYLTSAQKSARSIFWRQWKNENIALKHVEMKIRPAM
nr:hypothetical protein BaRGS_015050 [Batillaria attramentaria]